MHVPPPSGTQHTCRFLFFYNLDEAADKTRAELQRERNVGPNPNSALILEPFLGFGSTSLGAWKTTVMGNSRQIHASQNARQKSCRFFIDP